MSFITVTINSLIKYLFPAEQKRIILSQNIFAYLNPEGKAFLRMLSECEVKYFFSLHKYRGFKFHL